MKNQILVGLLSTCITLPAFGWGIKDLKKAVDPDLAGCDGDQHETTCKTKELATSAGTVVALGVAAKLMAEVAIDYNSRRVSGANEILTVYVNTYDKEPEEPVVMEFISDVKPNTVIKAGDETLIQSQLSVAAAKKVKSLKVEEKLEIYDAGDPTLIISSLTKHVNSDNQVGGKYENEFKFTLPVGMPQGVYQVKSSILLDGKEQSTIKNEMQLVLQVFADQSYQIALAY